MIKTEEDLLIVKVSTFKKNEYLKVWTGLGYIYISAYIDINIGIYLIK